MNSLILAVLFLVPLVSGQDQAWLEGCLNAHNEYRASEGKPPLTLNPEITQVAQAWADQLSSSCGFEHSQNPNYGENLAGGYEDCAQSVKQWTDEEKDYDRNNPVFSMKTGHYTQVVWKSTKELGCGIAPHCDYRYVTVCNYNPPGNYKGEFSENV